MIYLDLTDLNQVPEEDRKLEKLGAFFERFDLGRYFKLVDFVNNPRFYWRVACSKRDLWTGDASL